ncbi:MAG TPA: acyltransferase [Patescibacteria group bacterium]|nr:acyltransferase [Patescibacteria group bacterium]
MKQLKKKLALFLIPLVRYGEGRTFFKIRRLLYKQVLKWVGKDLAVYPGVFLKEPENLEIGDNVSILHFCFISAYGGVKIGSDVSVATGCKIFSSSHPYDDPSMRIKSGKLLKQPVLIGDDVWFGAGVIVTGGVNIGSGVVVGAGSVVTSDLGGGGIYAGVPAKFIKKRF